MLLSMKLDTFHISSYMICGSFTGKADGHAPPPEAPFPEYATWLLWSGLSRFLPSQHLEVS